MLRKTALHASHVGLGARMGEFAGYDMPLFYKDGVLKEHEWVRTHCGIFDVSHMGQVIISGHADNDSDAAAFWEKVTPSAFRARKHGRAQYTVLTNEQGGIVDDLIVTRLAENEFFAVLNAGCKDKDITWLKKHLPSNLDFYHMQSHSLIAVQGPWAARIVHEVFDFEPDSLPYMSLAKAQTRYGVPVFISRLGYTGEDGFEISMPDSEAPEIWDAMLQHGEVRPIGLAARDSLRLEMGYPLYGHDIDDTTSPVEARIEWVIRKDNRDFIGAERIVKELTGGVSRKRVGVRLLAPGVAREGAEIRDKSGNKIGALTSGGFSPTLKQSIGQGYIASDKSQPGEGLFVHMRDKNIEAEITAMPFVEAKTRSGKKAA